MSFPKAMLGTVIKGYMIFIKNSTERLLLLNLIFCYLYNLRSVYIQNFNETQHCDFLCQQLMTVDSNFSQKIQFHQSRSDKPYPLGVGRIQGKVNLDRFCPKNQVSLYFLKYFSVTCTQKRTLTSGYTDINDFCCRIWMLKRVNKTLFGVQI